MPASGYDNLKVNLETVSSAVFPHTPPNPQHRQIDPLCKSKGGVPQNIKLYAYMPTLPSWIIQECPGYNTNLPVSCTGHQISQIKSSCELFCALIWNLSHFLPKFEFFLLNTINFTINFIVRFQGHFCTYFITYKDYFTIYYNHKSEL